MEESARCLKQVGCFYRKNDVHGEQEAREICGPCGMLREPNTCSSKAPFMPVLFSKNHEVCPIG